jgi:hypothetical protein
MWRPRDHERFIGSYDPEREMPDPDRGRGDHWQSDAYRHNSRDSRFAYRWNPDRFEDRFGDRDRSRSDYDSRWSRDARDFGDRNYPERNYSDRSYGYSGGNDFDRGYSSGGGYYGMDYGYGPDRGYDRGYDRNRSWSPEDRGPRTEDGRYDNRFDGAGWRAEARGPRPEAWQGGGSDYDRAREFGGRGYERDWRDRQRFDRGDNRSEFNDDDYDRWRNRRW